MASAAYNTWTAVVKRDGGRVTVSPQNVPSAAYPAAVYVPKVNGHVWPLPDEYSANGATAYYHAPAQLMDEIRSFSIATGTETKAGADKLMNQWGIPDMFRGIGPYFKQIALIGGVVVAIYFFVSGKSRGFQNYE